MDPMVMIVVMIFLVIAVKIVGSMAEINDYPK
jgi:hypothetical protein